MQNIEQFKIKHKKTKFKQKKHLTVRCRTSR